MDEDETPWVGNHLAYQKFLAWLARSFDSTSKLSMESVCIIIGPPGVGKTYGMRHACAKLQKVLHTLDSQNIHNFKDCKDHICKMCSSNITSQFMQVTRADQIVCLEELETLMSMDRTFCHSLQKLLESKALPHVPIVMTCQYHEKRKVLEALEGATVIELCVPSEVDVLVFLRRRGTHVKSDMLLAIAESCQGNIGNALNMLEAEELGSSEGDGAQRIENGKIDTIPAFLEVYGTACPEIANRVFHEDPWLHPLRFHENLPHEMRQRKGLHIKKQRAYIEILKGMCVWDYMMSKNKGEDQMIPIAYVAHQVLHLRWMERKKQCEKSQDNFTKMFSHLSLEKKNQIATHHDEWENIGSYHKSMFEQHTKKKNFRREV